MNTVANEIMANEITANAAAIPGDILLRRGSNGNSVTTLQTLLNYRGAGLSVDGDFGPITEAGVIEFQNSVRLDADGIVGTLTWNSLRSASAIARIPGSLINLCATPDRNAAVLQTLSSSDRVVLLNRSAVMDEKYRWFQVQVQQQTGWIREDLIEISHALPKPLLIVNDVTIQSRPQPWWASIDPNIESVIRSTLNLGFRDRVRYLYRFAELNRENADNSLMLVYLFGDQVCGTGGCTMLVLEALPRGFRLISRITTVQETVIVSTQRTNGFPDLIVLTSGGGIPAAYRRLQFDGTSYPTNASAAPSLPAGTVVNGSAALTARISPDLAAPLVAV
jgi:peptidoglycan hydrolase-like protein with peptidoglycan-binding domain